MEIDSFKYGLEFVICVQQSNWFIVRWCVWKFGLVYTQYDAPLLLFHDLTIQVYPVVYGLHIILDVGTVNFKKSRHILSLPAALLQAALLKVALSSSSVMGVSRKSLHTSGNFLCTSLDRKSVV